MYQGFFGHSLRGKTVIVDSGGHTLKQTTYCQIRVWRSLERNQLIFVWYHADGEEPTYEPAIIPNVDGDLTSQEAWVYHGRNEYEVNICLLLKDY